MVFAPAVSGSAPILDPINVSAPLTTATAANILYLNIVTPPLRRPVSATNTALRRVLLMYVNASE
jgi:hypothetical protein